MRVAFAAILAAGLALSHEARADLVVASPAASAAPVAPPVAPPAPETPPAASIAMSTPAPTPTPGDMSSDLRWYGWQSFAAGGAGATLLFIGGALDTTGSSDDGKVAAYVWGGLIYGLGSFGVHMAHDNAPKALGSLAILSGVPLTGFAVGLGLGRAQCGNAECREHTAAWGALTGVLAAPIVDGLTLGWTHRASRRHAAGKPFSEVAIAPSVVPTRGGATFTVGGAF